MKNLNETGKITALVSFVLGTILLAFFLYFGESNFPIELGLGYVIVAAIVNIVIFSVILGFLILNPKHRFELLKTLGIMLLNIPIIIFYFYLIVIIAFPTKG